MRQEKLWMGMIGGLIGLILFGGFIDLFFADPSQSQIELFRTLAFVGLSFGPIYLVVQKNDGMSYIRSLLAALPVVGLAAIVLKLGGHQAESVILTTLSMAVFALLQSTSAYLLDRHTSRT